MNISPTEAEEALESIRAMAKKTKRAISASGGYAYFILWGVIWLVGFLGNQFLPSTTAGYVWMGIDILGLLVSWVLGMRISRGVRSATSAHTSRRLTWFWVLLVIYLVAVIGVGWPMDIRQIAMVIVLIAMVGWLAMSLLLSFGSVWLTLGLTTIALVGYFLLPAYFHLLMAVLAGGGLMVFGFYIRSRW